MTITSPRRSTATHLSGDSSRRLLAALVVATPVLLGLNAVFHPPVELTAESILAGAEAGPTSWFVVHVIAATGALLGVGAAAGLRTLVHGRGRRFATVGLTATAIGSPILAMTFAIEASVLALAAGRDDRATALAIVEDYLERPEFYALGAGLALVMLGALVMGIALMVDRAVPWWQSSAYVVATIATAVAPPSAGLGPVGFGVVAIVSVLFARRIVRGVT